MQYELNLNKPENAYIVGFAQTDGHLSSGTRNRGKLRFELSDKDADILVKIQSQIPYNSTISSRTRNTNFKKNAKSVTLTCCSLEFRQEISKYVPYGKKSKIIFAPPGLEESADYWRGIIDGDGSLGFFNGSPYISLNTSSDKLAEQYLHFINDVLGVKKYSNRNSRDKTYNIIVAGEKAKILTGKLYYSDCFGLDRKIIISKEIALWNKTSP